MRTSFIAGGGASGSTPVINQSALWANRTSYQTNGNVVRFTDVGGGTSGTGGGTKWVYTGTRWKLDNNLGLLDTIDTANSGVANTTPQNLNPNAAAIPAGVIQSTDRLYLRLKSSKSSNSDSGQLIVRLGSARTTADATIYTFTGLSAASISAGIMADFKRISATSVQRQGSGDANNSMGGASTSAYPSAVALNGADSFDTSILYLTIWQVMTGGTEFLTVQDYTVTLESTDS